VKAFILDTLRESARPLTSAEITDTWLMDRGLRADLQTRVAIRKRIGTALISSRRQGVVRNEGMFDGHKGWVVA